MIPPLKAPEFEDCLLGVFLKIVLKILLRILLRILLWILLRILLRSFPKGFTNNFTKHFTKDFNKDLSLVLVLSRAKRATRGRTTARCESNGIDGWTAYFIIHASIFTLSWSHLYNVPSGSRPKHLKTRPKAEFDGTGWTGRTGYQNCPLNFFILCVYIDKVYTYLYTKYKLSPTFLCVSKFDVKLGVGVKFF